MSKKLKIKLELESTKMLDLNFENSTPNTELMRVFTSNKTVTVFIPKNDRVIFIKNIVSFFLKASSHKRQLFSIIISSKKEKLKLTFNGKLLPVKDKNLKLTKDINFLEFIEVDNSIKENEIFYDCNIPEEKEGFRVQEVSEDLYKYVKEKETVSLKDFSARRTHYIKWHLTEDLSIRYFFTFEDQKEKENKFFMKSHKNKDYIALTKNQAEIIMNEFGVLRREEIFGLMKDNEYEKISI